MFKIIFLFIGTFVGAGFASGREIFNFFTTFGVYNSIISIFIFSILLFILVLKCINIKQNLNFKNYSEFILYLEKKYKFISYKFYMFIINIFLAASFYIMISSLCSLFSFQFNISRIITTFIWIFICFYIFSKNNLTFIYKINFILVPILILFISLFSIYSINLNNINLDSNNNIFICIFFGILYFSYNSLLLIPVVFNLDNIQNNNKKISFLFSFITFILLILFNILLLSYFDEIKNIDIPIIYLCNNKIIFLGFFIILSAILTTLFSSGYSFINNLNIKYKKIKLIVFLLISFIFSYFSLSNLINFFYPVFGLLGLLQIFLILNNKY